jgi:hypothetical protein
MGAMTLRVRKFSASRFRWEAWRGATLVRSGEAASLEVAQREATSHAATVPSAPEREDFSESPEAEPAAWGSAIRFVGGGVLVLVVLWEGMVWRSTGDYRGLVVATAGLASVTLLAVVARRRHG